MKKSIALVVTLFLCLLHSTAQAAGYGSHGQETVYRLHKIEALLIQQNKLLATQNMRILNNTKATCLATGKGVDVRCKRYGLYK